MTEAAGGAGEKQPCEQKPLRRVLISFGRCGTHWLQSMICAVLGKPPIELGLRNPETLVDILDRSGHQRLMYENFTFEKHGKILDTNRYPDLRMIVLHRHPLDQFISNIWHQMNVAKSTIVPNPDASPDENARGMLLGTYDKVGGERYEETFKAELRRRVLDWLDSRSCLSVKYEDLVENTQEELIRCLKYLEIRFDEADIPAIVESHRFEKQSGGRKPGEVDEKHTCRKGVPGEWRTVFKPEDMPILHGRYAGIIQRGGYGLQKFQQKRMRRVLVSYGRSGTHWLKNMISAALEQPPIEGGAWDTETLPAVLEGSGRRRLIYEHFRFDIHGEYLDPARYPDMKLLLLHRHPLDQFISATWHRLNITGELAGFDPQTSPNELVRGLLLGKYDERLGYSYGDAYLETYKRGLLDWIESGRCLQVRFEDLVAKTEQQLARALNHLEIRFDPADLAAIVEKNRFEKLSGGRKPGETDVMHHYRRGKPGEWQTVFTPEDLPILRERYGSYYELQGYPI